MYFCIGSGDAQGWSCTKALLDAGLCKHDYSDLWMLLVLQHNKTNNRQTERKE